jgi:hypothetical protein
MSTRALRPPGRRLAIRLAACAVLGAVVTVGVAWGVALWLTPPSLKPLLPEACFWPTRVPGTWATRPNVRWVGSSAVWHWEWAADAGVSRIDVFRCGFPMKACEATRSWVFPPGGVPVALPPLGLPVPPWLSRNVEVSAIVRKLGVPAIPMFPGFALDTAFYAALAFTLWSAPAVIGRRLRRVRGHCSACGYDLKGAPNATCPECGA